MFFREDLNDIYYDLSTELPKIEKNYSNIVINEIKKQISTPPPLKTVIEDTQSYLTREGVIKWTNIQRSKNGLSPLKDNKKLNVSAEIKAADMLKGQYFEHESPIGVGAGDLFLKVGYDFIASGENLAMGNFKDDQILVQAWMDSPGHRANILNNKYQEIGVAVIEGIFEEKKAWMAVQHFGLSLSSCPSSNSSLKTEIESNQSKLESMQNDIKALEEEMDSLKRRQRDLYMQKMEEYGNLVIQYNTLVVETKKIINIYNSQVQAFNNCIKAVSP